MDRITDMKCEGILKCVICVLLTALSVHAENAYTNHAGNAVAGWPVKLTATHVTLSEGDSPGRLGGTPRPTGAHQPPTTNHQLSTINYQLSTTYPLSIFPESEQRRIAADFLLRQDVRLRQVDKLRVPLAVKRAISGAEKAIARSRKRAEKGFCTKEECEAFCSQSAAALKRYLDKQVNEGVITPAERRVLALYGVGDCALTTSGCHDNKQGER